MAKSSDHITQWKHNRSFLSQVPPKYPDWIVTVAFYTALHAVSTLLASENRKSIVTHHARSDVLMRVNRYKRIRDPYHTLYNLSRTIRYMANPSGWVPIEKIESEIFQRLYMIERSVQNLLKTDLDFSDIKIQSE